MINSMEELLASQKSKLISLHRGLEVEGKIVAISDKEITLDIGAKSEGILQSRDFPRDQLENLKIGDKLKAYVLQIENESGQVVLTLQRSLDSARDRQAHLRGGKFRGGKSIDWSKFIQAQNQNSKLNGKILEINKGGLIIEVEGSPREAGVRGFLPNSQVGFELMTKAGGGMEELIGQEITVNVIEIDQANNRLIFSQRGQVSEDIQKSLQNFKPNQKIKGRIVAILPFGLIVDISGVEGIVFISDVAWEKVEDLSNLFKVGMEIEAQVIGIDDQLGRVNLSIKHLTEDPFGKLAEKFPADEVVKGEVVGVDGNGVLVRLEDPSGESGIGVVEGFIPASKMGSAQYEVGKIVSVLVDNVDKNRRRVNLAPMITSTEGLIYK